MSQLEIKLYYKKLKKLLLKLMETNLEGFETNPLDTMDKQKVIC